MSTLHKYTNKSTGDVHTFVARNMRLDALGVWAHEEIADPDHADVAAATAAAQRAEAERRVVEDGARTRSQHAELYANEALNTALASAPPPYVPPANVTAAHQGIDGDVVVGGVLTRSHATDYPDPAILARQAEADSLAIHALGDDGAVMTRLASGTASVTPEQLREQERAQSEYLHQSGAGVLGERTPPDLPTKPAPKDSQAKWVEYVVTVGIRIREEAEHMTKADLVKAVAEAEVETP